MNTTNLSRVLLYVLVMSSLAFSTGRSRAAGDSPAELREEGKLMFGALPDRMPDADQDTPARVALGRELYFDPRLSENNSQSCNTCHRVDENRPGVDHEPTSPGAFGKRGDRNAPTVLNAGFHLAQFWDGRAPDLEEQAKGPVLNPVEMAMPSEAVVMARLKADPQYPELFAKAFPADADPMTYDRMAEAIAAFERTFVTRDRFDDFLLGQDNALSGQELKGLRVFLDTGCTACHSGALIGANQYQKVGLINPYENAKDLGRYDVTKDEDDRYKFKVPSLRNVALTWPYLHDGKVATLPEAIRKMGHMQLGLELTDAQVNIIAAFLGALSDKERGRIAAR